MHVAVFGAGALGCVYGVRLALRAQATVTSRDPPSADPRPPETRVTFVVRAARAASREPITIERARKRSARETIEAPARAAHVPDDADVVLLAVGAEDLDAIRAPLEACDVPIVVLTPMMPRAYAAMRATFGERVFAAMPSVVSYARHEDGVIRYWIAPPPTRIDEPRAGASVVRELAAALSEAGIPTRLDLGVHESNPATTVCFIPLVMAICAAGSLEALAADAGLAQVAAGACAEGTAIARTITRIGRPEPGATFAPLLARPLALRGAIAALRIASPEAYFYLEEHFGRKLAAQHVAMAGEMARIAEERGLAHVAIDALARRLADRPNK